MERYSVVTDKNPREIVKLRSRGCEWGKCTVCRYDLSCLGNDDENYEYNRETLGLVTGIHGVLEISNPGGFSELDGNTMNEIVVTCMNSGIEQIYFKSHWNFKDDTKTIRDLFGALGVVAKFTIDVETFDFEMREKVLVKGIPVKNAMHIAEFFDAAGLLVGVPGQTIKSMSADAAKGLECFERISITIMPERGAEIHPDEAVIEAFKEHVMPKYAGNNRVEILD